MTVVDANRGNDERRPVGSGRLRACDRDGGTRQRPPSFLRKGRRQCEADGQRRGRNERERGTNGRPQRGGGENRERYGSLARRAGLKSGKLWNESTSR